MSGSTEPGGSEQVVEQLALEWPSAKVYVPIAEDSPEFEALRERVWSPGWTRCTGLPVEGCTHHCCRRIRVGLFPSALR